GWSISLKVMPIPLASAAAVPKISSSVLAIRSFYSSVAPDRSLVARASAGLPGGNAVGLADRAELLHLLLIPSFDHAADASIGLDQEHGGNVRDPEGIAGGEAVLGIEQGREGEIEGLVELARVAGVVLRDAVDAEFGMQALDK